MEICDCAARKKIEGRTGTLERVAGFVQGRLRGGTMHQSSSKNVWRRESSVIRKCENPDVKNAVSIAIPEEVWDKVMSMMRLQGSDEWFCYFVGEERHDNDEVVFAVEDILIPDQIAGMASVDVTKQPDVLTLGALHSHGSGGITHSQIDDKSVDANNRFSIVANTAGKALAFAVVKVPCGHLAMVEADVYVPTTPADEWAAEQKKLHIKEKRYTGYRQQAAFQKGGWQGGGSYAEEWDGKGDLCSYHLHDDDLLNRLEITKDVVRLPTGETVEVGKIYHQGEEISASNMAERELLEKLTVMQIREGVELWATQAHWNTEEWVDEDTVDFTLEELKSMNEEELKEFLSHIYVDVADAEGVPTVIYYDNAEIFVDDETQAWLESQLEEKEEAKGE